MVFSAICPPRGACVWLVLVLVSMAAMPLRNSNAASATVAEDRVALVIGNAAYKVAPLVNPVNDATDIARALESAGFKVILRRNAGTREMRQAIRDFGVELRRAQVGLFYFAGHGVQVKDWRNPGFAQSDDDPVACVNWNDAKAYVEWLSKKSGQRYRLPTEAEWEYAARAGTTTAFSFGERITSQQANYGTSASYAGSPVATTARSTLSVGSYAPNAFGLYDVHGNVWEWTEDCWNGNYNNAPSDGSAWTSGDCGRRVLRGGAWNDFPGLLRSADRFFNDPSVRSVNLGFRLVRTD